MIQYEPLHLSSTGGRVASLCYGFLALILINTCEACGVHWRAGTCNVLRACWGG